ncbi:MAG: hypothetical protein H6912_04330 [Kordiimonadaceae bacterium]|nr:hypothetical protein [Kordiimonadaceae bacterium]
MSKKDKENKTGQKKKNDVIELNSPPCLMSEVNPDYMGLNDIPENNQKKKKENKKKKEDK